MKLPIFQVDAFAEELFQGNPAAVVPLENWLPDQLMQSIALENNLSETAFFVPMKAGFEIRWFTPKAEVDLCGYATLATAHAIFNEASYPSNKITFGSRSGEKR
ncbi:PhzF family phenazine biosynthesis isomerase [uncultured Sunxiuqinia sp.]|uniref:PhzF family phenazine biosynthesis protein n=1 Tax=uncultured Sunxiuqinia sp. TaxID=1573825 RepID=UPI002AA9317F|nr:PhzF family phenazine biosynthesis isomerase [uncultured Sunxiuqinia sp.]